jgi:threonine dehydrogenase-like Zn-dependent dehydrogenase
MVVWDVHAGKLRRSHRPPPLPGSQDALVAVRFCGICGSDLAKLTRTPIASPPTGCWRPGHEIVGWEVTHRPSRLVAVNPIIPCELCGSCRKGRIDLCPDLRRIGWDLPGGFADFVAVPKGSLVPIPNGPESVHAVLADPLAVAIHGIRCGLRARAGILAVVGSGPIAVCSAAYAAQHGWEVFVVVRDLQDLSKLQRLVGLVDATFATHQNCGLRGRCDAVVDAASGHDDAGLRQALDLVRDGGTVVVQTAYDPSVRLDYPLRSIFRRSITVRGRFSFCRSRGCDDFAEALAILASRPSWASALTSCRVPLASLPDALNMLSAPSPVRPIKVVLTVQPGESGHPRSEDSRRNETPTEVLR